MMLPISRVPLLKSPLGGKLASRKKQQLQQSNDLFTTIYRNEENSYGFAPSDEPYIEAQWDDEDDWSSVNEPYAFKLYKMVSHLRRYTPRFLAYHT
ncbi:hypothetical protein K1X76_11910 [bacterium]|nr:hypothetical protein [bacterium]